MNKVAKDTLLRLYITEEKPMHAIARELGIAVGSVYNYLKAYEIQTRPHSETFTMKGRKLSEENCKRISEMHKGKTVSFETRKKISESKKVGGIGHKKLRTDGYFLVYFPDHPKSTKEGYVMEHDLIMECIIGRHLKDDEVVHHINFKRNDNRKENLQLMTKSEHMSFHSRKRNEERKVMAY